MSGASHLAPAPAPMAGGRRATFASQHALEDIAPEPSASSSQKTADNNPINAIGSGLRKFSVMVGFGAAAESSVPKRKTSGHPTQPMQLPRKSAFWPGGASSPADEGFAELSSFSRGRRFQGRQPSGGTAGENAPAPAASTQMMQPIEQSPTDAALAGIAQPARLEYTTAARRGTTMAGAAGGPSQAAAGGGGGESRNFLRRGSSVVKEYLFRAPKAAPVVGETYLPDLRRKASLAPTAAVALPTSALRTTTGDNSVGGGGLQPNGPAAAVELASTGRRELSSEVNKRILAPFRRKSMISRLLLGTKAVNTGNPERFGLDFLVIHPNNRLKVAFDILVQCLTLYSLSTVPITFAFGSGAPATFDLIVDMIFIADVVLHFFHGFVERGYPVTSLERVAVEYFRSWFVIELIAALPYDLMTSNKDWSAMSLLRCIRLRRLGLVIANSRIGTTSSGLAAFVNVFMIVCAWVLVAHCFACIFFALGWRLRCQGEGYQQTWLDLLEHPVLELPTCDEINEHYPDGMWNLTAAEYFKDQEHGTHWMNLWVLTLHWAISSMSSLGYGRGPMAVTVPEFVFTTFCQVLGACLYAAIFGNIAQLLAKLDAPGARYRAQRDKIDEFVAFHELPSELTSKLHAYCKFLFAVNHGFDVGQISGALPPNLQHQLLLHLHAPLVKAVPMFEDCDDAFIKAIVLQLRPQVLLGGDAAFKAGEAGTEMYFIMRGEMRMMDASLSVCYNALYSGAYFGELAMLTGQPRTATALAVTDCVLFYINQSDFNLVARKWPKALATILAKAKERLERINNANSKSLAFQLGERLGDIRAVLDETDEGVLGLVPAPSGGDSFTRQTNMGERGESSSASFKRRTDYDARETNLFHSQGSFNDRSTRLDDADGADGGGSRKEKAARRSIAALVGDGGPDAARLPPPGMQAVLQQTAFAAWQNQMERQVSQANEGVQQILERIGLVFEDNGSGTTDHLSGARNVLGAGISSGARRGSACPRRVAAPSASPVGAFGTMNPLAA